MKFNPIFVFIQWFLVIFLTLNMIVKDDYTNPYRNTILVLTILNLVVIRIGRTIPDNESGN